MDPIGTYYRATGLCFSGFDHGSYSGMLKLGLKSHIAVIV